MKRAFAVLACVSLLLLAYTAYRAATLSITYDEGWSLTGIGHSVMDLMTWRHNDVNTHPLNSVLMKVARRVFGPQTFVYRLPNVGAHVLYLAASLALARRARSVAAMLLGFALLNLNPFLLDFFSLARGYGIALACTLCGLVFLARAMEDPGALWETAACAALALATLANLAFLHALAAVFAAVVLLGMEGRRWRSLVGPAVVTFGVLAWLFPSMRRLQEAGQFYFGGFDAFWKDTVGSLTQTLLYREAPDTVSGALTLLVGVSSAFLGVAAFRAWKENGFRLQATPSAVFFLVLCVPAITTTALHFLQGSRFLLERTALLFVPLFAVAVQTALEARGRLLRGAAVALALLLAANTVRAANLHYTLSWRYDADVHEVVRLLEEEHRRTGRPIELLHSWPFKFPVNYYVKAKSLTWLTPVVYEYGEKKTRFDYCYLLDGDYDFGYRLDRAFLEANRSRIVRTLPVSGSFLLKGDKE